MSGAHNVNVSPPAAAILLSGFEAQPVNMKVKGTLQLTAEVDPDDAFSWGIWSGGERRFQHKPGNQIHAWDLPRGRCVPVYSSDLVTLANTRLLVENC